MKPPGRQTILGSGKEAAEAVYGTNGEERREELHPKPLNQREMNKTKLFHFSVNLVVGGLSSQRGKNCVSCLEAFSLIRYLITNLEGTAFHSI